MSDAWRRRPVAAAGLVWTCVWLFFALATGSLAAPNGGGLPTRTLKTHWQQVPLGDAVARLESYFGERAFMDRRVDASRRVTLDIEAASADEALMLLANTVGLGSARLGPLVYVGPSPVADQIGAIAAVRSAEVARLAPAHRTAFVRPRPLDWPRLTEPRELITSLVERHGWRVLHAEQIPHDLWPAGALPNLSLAEQLTVLLAGFDLTFELRPRERTVVIVPLQLAAVPQQAAGRTRTAPRRPAQPSQDEAKRVYTLRVQEQPVRAVLRELTQRLNWDIHVDEEAIRASAASLDGRVSFAVENVGPDELLEALLRPAGLAFRRDGERITIIPRDN